MIHHYVEKARQDLDMSAVTRVAIDETSFRRRQDDVTLSCDLGTKRVTFDRFHLAKLLSEAIDTVRREERRTEAALLRRTRSLWLKRPENLTVRQKARLEALLPERLKTVRAYRWRLSFDQIFELPPPEAEEALAR